MDITTSLDKLVIYVENVEPDTYFKFQVAISRLEGFNLIPQVYETIGMGLSEYHYNLNIGQGTGAVRIGYKHNSCKENQTYTMRIEFNPNSQNEEHYKYFWDLFKKHFKNYKKLIKQLDLAFDLACEPIEIISTSLTGRQRTILKDTTYFGSRGNNGRLKIYNKKKEIEDRLKIKLEEDLKLTRIEYTWRFDKAVTVQILSSEELKFNEQYKIAFLNLEKQSGEMKAILIAFHEGRVQWNEFTRTTKNKIKKAIENMQPLDIDTCFLNAKKNIIEKILSYFR